MKANDCISKIGCWDAQVTAEESGCYRLDQSGSTVIGHIGTDEAARGEEIVQEITGIPRAETRSTFDVCEAFSPPRICPRASKFGLKGGWSLDISADDPVSGQKWDLADPATQRKVRYLVRTGRPAMLVVGPPCTLFSLLQNLCPNGLPQRTKL